MKKARYNESRHHKLMQALGITKEYAAKMLFAAKEDRDWRGFGRRDTN